MKLRKPAWEAVLALIILVAGALFAFYSTRQAVENHEAYSVLLTKQAAATREAEKHRSLQKSLEPGNLEATKEAVARNELNMKRSGEKAEVIVEPTPTPTPGASASAGRAFHLMEWLKLLRQQ